MLSSLEHECGASGPQSSFLSLHIYITAPFKTNSLYNIVMNDMEGTTDARAMQRFGRDLRLLEVSNACAL